MIMAALRWPTKRIATAAAVAIALLKVMIIPKMRMEIPFIGHFKSNI
jgi:hypothetical protein